jgi:predicted HTH domain antitoxin
MAMVTVEVDDAFLTVLEQVGQPVERAALELMLLELYRRGTVSSGWAARRLGMDRVEFIRHASELGIPYFRMTEEEWQAELRAVEELAREVRSLPTAAR